MQWIKEVELVDSVDELRSSSSTPGISMPNFEVLDARIASALNKIIHNSHFKRRISLEEQKAQKENRFLRGRQIAFLMYDPMDLAHMCVKHQMRLHVYQALLPRIHQMRFICVSPNAFICVSPNASAEFATELASLLCSLRSHVFF